MIDINNLTEHQIQKVGQLILEKINPNLFNSCPTIHKAYHVYKELTHYGYKESDKELAISNIRLFFKRRTVKNQAYEFTKIFKITYQAEMCRFLSLSYRTSFTDSDQVYSIAASLERILSPLGFSKRGVDQDLLKKALFDLYNPSYFENEWSISMPELENKIVKHLTRISDKQTLYEVKELFFRLDPNPNKKIFRKTSQDTEDSLIDDKSLKKIVTGNKEHINIEGGILYISSDDNLLTSNVVIRDSEVNYVRQVLDIIKGEEMPEELVVSLILYESMHPQVKSFILSVRSYNRIFQDRESSVKDIVNEMRATLKSLKETGGIVVRDYEEMVGQKTSLIMYEVKKVG